MQPASSSVPTYRRHPAAVPSDGSQHCAAITTPDTVVIDGSSTHVEAGKSPRPPSSTCLGDHGVGALLGDRLGDALGDVEGDVLETELGDPLGATLGRADGDTDGDALGAELGEPVGCKLGDKLGDKLGVELGDPLGDSVHPKLVHTGCSL